MAPVPQFPGPPLGAPALHSPATIPADKNVYQRQIETTDQGIEAVQYESNGRTEEEIAILEGRDH